MPEETVTDIVYASKNISQKPDVTSGAVCPGCLSISLKINSGTIFHVQFPEGCDITALHRNCSTDRSALSELIFTHRHMPILILLSLVHPVSS